MSLICVACGKIIVLSDHPDHLAGCSSCTLTKEQGEEVQKSSQAFHKKAKEHNS